MSQRRAILKPEAPGQKIGSGFFRRRVFSLREKQAILDKPVSDLILKIDLNIAPFVVSLSSNGPATTAVDAIDEKTNRMASIGTTAGLLTIRSTRERNGPRLGRELGTIQY